jgi:hypothetical protein
MQSQNNARRANRLLGLIDAAVNPAVVYPLLEKSGAGFRSVFAGLPEDALGPASLFLATIDDAEADWVLELDRLDLHSPCLSLIWSRVDLDDMVKHLQAFLFADIGDGMTAMVGFFDPRNAGAVFKVWGDQIGDMFIGPIERWMYRGRHAHWQCIENDSLTGARICRSIVVELEQADIDALTGHTEPDELLAALIQSGVVDGEGLYLDRFADFMPRYQRAAQWGLTEAADRLYFCQFTYLYGPDFDRHLRVHDALATRKNSGRPFRLAIDQLPPYVWGELERERHTEKSAPGLQDAASHRN